MMNPNAPMNGLGGQVKVLAPNLQPQSKYEQQKAIKILNNAIAVQGRQLARVKADLESKAADLQIELDEKNVQLATLLSWKTEYKNFASVTSTAFGLASGLIAPYLALNSSLVTQQVELFERSVSTLGGHAMLPALVLIGLASYAIGSKVAPATVYALLKFINGVKDLSIATTVYLTKLVFNFFIGTIKLIFKWRTELLALTFVLMLTYYNPTVNAMVVPPLKNIISQGSIILAPYADAWTSITKDLSTMVSGYNNSGGPVTA